MARTVVSLLIAVASGLLLFAATSALELLDPLLRGVLAIGLGAVVALIGVVVSGRVQQPGKRETASNLRSGRDVKINGVRVKGATGDQASSSTASGIRAAGGIEITDVEEDLR